MPGDALCESCCDCLGRGILPCRMNNDPLSPLLDQLFPGARVHHGFLDQFRAVTEQAANSSVNVKCAAQPFNHASLLSE